jgi:cell wall-associated NlpC family hydrolase
MRGSLGVLIGVLMLGGCASSGAVPRPYPGGVAPPVTRADTTSTAVGRASAGDAVAAFALSLAGAPYREGGADPAGFDCSGFVQFVFRASGIALPRDVGGQQAVGEAVGIGALRPGDLIFFAIDGRTVSHVAILTAPDTFVHAPSTGGRVRVERLSADYWARRFAGARRITG